MQLVHALGMVLIFNPLVSGYHAGSMYYIGQKLKKGISPRSFDYNGKNSECKHYYSSNALLRLVSSLCVAGMSE